MSDGWMTEGMIFGILGYLVLCGVVLNILFVVNIFIDEEGVSGKSLDSVCRSLNGLEWEFDEEKNDAIVCKKTDLRFRGGGE